MLYETRRRPRPRRVPDAQHAAPYAEALQRFAASQPASFMVPGHGNDPDHGAAHLASFYGAATTQLDVPLMLDGIDLGDDAPLARAHELAAQAWGARRTWFMTNGASQANRTAALAVRGLGENVLVQRSAHSSFTDGVVLAGLSPAFVMPSIDLHHGIAHGVSLARLNDALEHAADEGRPVASVYVVSPSYFGSTADVAGLAAVAHAHGAALIVDDAWGAHFGFHPELPDSPVRLGADLVVSSTHKLAGSLTQSAMLHLGDTEFAERLEPLVARAYSMTASTSTSSLLLSSLDLARRALVIGEQQIGDSIAAAQRLCAALRADSRFSVISDAFVEYDDIIAVDALRVPIDVTGTGQSGHWVRDRLIRDHGVYLEMSTATSVVVVIGALQSPDIDRLLAALSAVADVADASDVEADAAGGADAAGEPHAFPVLPSPGALQMAPRDAFFGANEVVSADAAVGRVSADTLAAYPPGIPNVLPGEEITEAAVAFLRAVAASPTGYVRGAVDAEVSAFRVVVESDATAQ